MPPKTESKSDALADLLEKGRGAGGPAAEALRKAARLERERGDVLAAVALLRDAAEKCEIGPADPKLHATIELELGTLYEVELGRIDQAIAHYQQANKLNPDDQKAIDSGRRVYRALGDWVQVARLYEVEVETSADPARRAEMLVQLGLLRARRVGDLVGAVVRLEEAVRLRHDDIDAKEALAGIYMSPDFPAPPGDTVGPFERAAELFLDLAELSRSRGNREAEIGFLKRALGADPYHVDAATRLERAYSAAGRTDELRRLYRLDAPLPRRSVKRAVLAAQSGDLAEATEAAVAANAEGDDAFEALQAIEKLLEEKKDIAGLADLKQKLLDTAPPSDPADWAQRSVEIAELWKRANQPRKQEVALRAAVEMDPAHPQVWRDLADLLAAHKDHAGLMALAGDPVDAAPVEEQPARLAAIAELVEKKAGDAEGAADLWRRVEEIDPGGRASSELRRINQKLDRWASLANTLERELAGAHGTARADVLKRLAQVERERYGLERAQLLLDEALDLRPDDGTLYRALADIHEARGDAEAVAKTLRRQLKAAKEKVERLNLLRRLAATYEDRLDDPDGVVWACEAILEILPGDRDSLRRLAAAYEKSGPDGEEGLVKVLESHAQAAATPTERIPLLHRLAVLHERRGEYPQAADRLEKLLKLDKSDGKAQEAIARIYEKLERWADAALAYERVLQRVDAPSGPEGAEGWKRFARIVDGKLNDAQRGLRAWKEVLERRPTDRDALEALARLARARGDHALLDEVLARRQQHAEGAEAAAIAVERAELAEPRDPKAAIQMLRVLLEELDPRNLAAHAHLRRLMAQNGRVEDSLRIAERELFLTEDDATKLDIALDIARTWRDTLRDPRRALQAFERVIDMDPTHPEALESLAALYAETGDWEKHVVIDEHRLGLAEGDGNTEEMVRLLFELAIAAEQKLSDAPRAFEYLKRAEELQPTDGNLAELRRIAEVHGLWEELCAVYSQKRGLEPRLRVAEIADEKLDDPARAFAVLRGSLSLDPEGRELQPELERLSERANDPAGLLDAYEKLLERRSDRVDQLDLLARRARVREDRMNDASGALDENLHAFRIAPGDPAVLDDVRRLAAVTGRWEDLLSVEGFRFHRASGADKLAIALGAAKLVEEKVKDKLRAFRAYLRAFKLAPDDTTVRDQLWRLARELPEIDEKEAAHDTPSKPPLPPSRVPPLPRSVMPGAVPQAINPAKEPTLEIKLDELLVEESAPIKLDPVGERRITKDRKDPTVELTIGDLMPMLKPPVKKPPAHPQTVELSLSDVSVLTKGARKSPPLPPGMPPMLPGVRAAAQPLPVLRPGILSGPHSAWDELAVVILALPANDPSDHFAHLLRVSEMWELGARDLDKAFESLASAFRIDPDDPQARSALDRLAQAHDAWDRLVAVIDDVIEDAGGTDRVVRLLVDSAGVRERQGQIADAEERYVHALGIKPSDEPALERLEVLYRQAGRLQDLATLLEKRLSGMLERMPPGEPRRLRALELASVYEKLGNTYEAIDAWKRVADENPDHPDAFASLARLFESVGQWSKVVESLTRELDVLETTGRSREQRERARGLRRRVAEIYEKELELPDRAIEAYQKLQDASGKDSDAAADAALEKLYERHGRFADLELLLKQLGDRTDNKEEKAKLLFRRATLLEEKLRAQDGVIVVLQELHKLRPDDQAVGTRLENALAKAGRSEEQAEALRERIKQLGSKRAPKAERAHLWVELARIEAALGRGDEAQQALEKALDLKHDDPEALAELARLREGGSDWDGYAAAREREADVAEKPELVVRALIDAARAHADKRNDPASARRCLERALEKAPKSAEALAALGPLLRAAGDDLGADALALRELALDPPPTDERSAALQVELGASLLKRGSFDDAARAFREALEIRPGFPAAVEGLADVAARTDAWDEVEALLRDAANKGGVPAEVAAQFHRRLADAAQRQGRDEEAYTALLEADRLVPGELRTRLLLGENRYRVHRYREAAQYLTALADHADVGRYPDLAGEALYHGALAEFKLRRPERAGPLLERAVAVFPKHADALGLLAERALETGDLQLAVSYLERQAAATTKDTERAVRWQRVAEVVLSELHDPARACAAFEHACDATGDAAPAELLEKTLGLQRDLGRVERAEPLAARLLSLDAPPPERARRLREAASIDAALGKTAQAETRLRAALELDPRSEEALSGLSAILVAAGKDEDAAALLTRSLSLLPPPADAQREGRAVLWMRLGECRERMRDARHAMAAFEKALEADPSRRTLRETLLDRYGDDPALDEKARAHRAVLLADDPLHVPSLRAMAKIDARNGARDGGRRYLELLAVAGAITDAERRALSDSAPPEPAAGAGPSLDEDDHAALAYADALVLAPVFAALWEGNGGERAPDLAHYGVKPEDRVSPVASSELSAAYALTARVLGNRKTGLYMKPDPTFTQLAIVAQPPTAIVVGASFASGRSLGDVRFQLGRALELARPEYVLAEALPREEFTRLFSAILRAFHPRHARRVAHDDEAARWKRALPYKVAKRLAELFASHADTEFSSALWRRAVRWTANRAGLVACGDLIAAARVLATENDPEAVRELARFAASDDYQALRTKLTLH
jgi:tetratricopeptide (TPR) repeat protein